MAAEWRGRFLRTGRVAAFLILTTGLNGAVAAYAPRYEPIYIYLVSVAIVAWLGSMLLGVVAAIAAVFIYDWMFAPVSTLPSASAIVPLAVAASVAVATRLARVPVVRMRPQLPVTNYPLLPPVPEPSEATADALVDWTAEINNLQARLADALTAAEREAQLRAEAGAATRVRVATLQRELDDMREQVVQQSNRVAALRVELENTKRESRDSLNQALEAAGQRVEEERERADRESRLREQDAATARQELEKAAAEIAAKYHGPLTEAKKSLADAFTRLPQLEQQLMETRHSREEALSRIPQLEQQLAQERAEIELERGRAADVESRLAAAAREAESLRAEAYVQRTRGDREALLREQLEVAAHEKLDGVVNDLSAKYESGLAEARNQVADLQNDAASLRQWAAGNAAEVEAQLAAWRADRDAAMSRAAHLEREIAEVRKSAEETIARDHATFDENLQRIVTGLTKDYEDALGEAMIEKASARAETRNLSMKLEDMQRRLLDFDRLQADVAKAMRETRRQLDEARLQAAQEKTAREQLDLEWSEKLQRIVTNLATDHEHDLGEAMLEKEAAKAEVRKLTSQLQALDEQRRQVADPAKPRGSVVLVVHSDAGVRAMSRHALESSGYAVITAADGLEGYRVAAAQRPAAVLAEAVMPKMDGRELVQLLKSRPETAGIKIVLIGGANVADIERGADYRADDFLSNATDFNLMRSTLANMLKTS